MTPCGRIVFASAQLILLYLGCSKLAKDLVTWQAMVGRHILEDIVGRVAQLWTSIILLINGTWAMIAWVAQSALKYRPRMYSKCLEGALKMIVCPKKLLPMSHLGNCCMPLDNKCRIGPLLRLQTRVGHQH
ncbi:hypothetical protein TNCV_3346731 [Trichonephila clavipes]|nr:hypothetical protein TNCV_3346731 [Trichonephila clavipes]